MNDSNKQDSSGTPSLSVSQLTTFIHCRYKWYLGYLAFDTGIQLKQQYLSTPIKLGAIWDRFQNSWYAGEKFSKPDLQRLCTEYDLSDTDAAKLFGLISAWHQMELNTDRINARPQYEFYYHSSDLLYQYHGIIDILYPDYIIENKLTGRPEQYKSRFTIDRQACMYFIPYPDTQYIIIRAVRTPSLKLQKNESIDEYAHRITADVISRPSHYFLNYNRELNVFGMKFHRGEFDIASFRQDFRHVCYEINECRNDHTLCYQDKLSCFVPAQCEFLQVCELGQVNWDMFEKKVKEVESTNNNKVEETEGTE